MVSGFTGKKYQETILEMLVLEYCTKIGIVLPVKLKLKNSINQIGITAPIAE